MLANAPPAPEWLEYDDLRIMVRDYGFPAQYGRSGNVAILGVVRFIP